MQDDRHPPAPSYTTASLVMAGINLFCFLVVLWASFGLFTVIMLAFLASYLIDRMEASRGPEAHPVRIERDDY